MLLADRITIDRTGQAGLISTAPPCFRREDGFAVVFRYGAVVFAGLSPATEEAVLAHVLGKSVALARTVAVKTFTDMIDTARSVRLELLVVILILAELVVTALTLPLALNALGDVAQLISTAAHPGECGNPGRGGGKG